MTLTQGSPDQFRLSLLRELVDDGSTALAPRPDNPPTNTLLPEVPGRSWLELPDTIRSMGTHIQAGRGSGKSRLMGRVIGWQDFLRGVPTVIFDPMGSTIDNIIDKVGRLTIEEQLAVRAPWRLRYVDMAGAENVVPFPLYYQTGSESHYEVARRFPATIQKIDPALESAPILGLNALNSMATRVGIILSGLGYQITEAADLLANPERWDERLRQLEVDQPETSGATRFFRREYSNWSTGERRNATNALSAKLDMFQLDPKSRAMFGWAERGIDWEEVVLKRQIVLLDFRREHDPDRRKFKMMWAFQSLFEFIKLRGRVRSNPISVIVDELTELTNYESNGVDLFAKDLDALVNVYARNCMVWLTIAHQEAFQLSDRMLRTLMSMGTQILGVTSDMDTALDLARQYFPYRPHWAKRHDRVWMSDMIMGPYVVDLVPVEFTVEEQQYLTSQYFRRLGLFEFLVRPAKDEGDISGSLFPVNIKNFDRGQWVDEELVHAARCELRKRIGVPVSEALQSIDQRLNPTIPALPVSSDRMVAVDEQFYDAKSE